MSIPKMLFGGVVLVFAAIGVAALFKQTPQEVAPEAVILEVSTKEETPVISVPVKPAPPSVSTISTKAPSDDFPAIDRIFQLISTTSTRLPIVETITYSSSVPWLKGRPAWIADYATHYKTSRHFIARSLNGKPDYLTQKVFEGSKFNVFRKDKQIQFYLLCDLTRLKMGFYYVDLDTQERVLLKSYPISAGRLDPTRGSGSLTPLGRYELGDRIAVYKPGIFGSFGEQQVEMISLFGTRWIPFGKEVSSGTLPKGLGVYGAPWIESEGEWKECVQVIGQYTTDGGIQMRAKDLEEVFAIVVSKPAFIEVVKNFQDAKLPGIEVAIPMSK